MLVGYCSAGNLFTRIPVSLMYDVIRQVLVIPPPGLGQGKSQLFTTRVEPACVIYSCELMYS